MARIPYKVTTGKKTLLVLVESSAERPQTNFAVRKPEDLAKSAEELSKALEPLTAIANRAYAALKSARPGKVEIQFGVELGAEGGIPLITQGSAKANLQVTLTWAGNEKADD